MKIQRTIPPAAAPINLGSLLHGLAGIFFRKRYLERLEREIKEYFGVKHVFLFSSGKAALAIILNALHSLAPNKRKVLIPAYTCFSVPSAIVKAELEVSLCDVKIENFDFDYGHLNKVINENTLCIVPNHLFGIPSDMDRIRSICQDRNVYIVEDAAQAMGGKYKGNLLGTIGDVGFFSLGRGKNITCGSGGIIVTDSDVIASAIGTIYCRLEKPRITETVHELLKALLLAVFIHPSLYWLPAGLPFLKLGETIFYKDFPVKRLSGMSAGMMRKWQQRLEYYNQTRKECADYYCGTLRPGLQWKNIHEEASLRLPLIAGNREIREHIYNLLWKKGLGVSKMYPVPINEIAELKDQFRGKEYPAAHAISERLFTLPTHPLLSENLRKTVCDVLNGTAGASEMPQEINRYPVEGGF
jgi:perosamine synthetase